MSALPDSIATAQAQKIITDAFGRFTAVVTPEDITAFNSTTVEGVIDALRVIQQDLREKRENRNLRKLVPFLEGLKKYGAAMDVIGNEFGPFMPCVWAPMRLFLQITAGHLDAFDKLVEAYSKIADTLPRISMLSETFSDKPSMLTKIALYFADLLEFHRRAYKFVRRRSWKSFFMITWGQFDLRFESILKSLTYNSDAIIQEAATIDLYEARSWREKLMDDVERKESDRAERQRLSLLAWLGVQPVSQEEEREKLLHDCIPGTSNWIREKLRGWLEVNTRRQSVVWLHGKPGAGKSVLCASLIESLDDARVHILYYFCQRQPSATSSQILKALVQQAVVQDTTLIPVAYTNFVVRHASPTRSILREMLFGSAKVAGLLLELSPCRLIVDGIDECDDNEQKLIVEDLMHVVSSRSASTNSKLLICSRDIRTISRATKKKPKDLFEISLSAERDFLNATIRSFISKRVEDMKIEASDLWDGEHQVEDIQQAIIEKADGMFLWVKLVLDTLTDVDSTGELYNSVLTMPKELPQLYGKILERMSGGITSQQKNTVHRILAWLTFAKRPLRRHELLHAASITYNDPVLNKWNMLQPTVIHKCKPLVEELWDGTVVFVHATVEEYLRESFAAPCFDVLDHKELIAYTCVSTLRGSLTLLDPDISLSIHLNRVAQGLYFMLPYAIDFWTQHVQEATTCQQLNLPTRLALELSRLDSHHEQLRQKLLRSSFEATAEYQQTNHPLVDASIYELYVSFLENHNVHFATNGEEWQQFVRAEDPTLLNALSAKLDDLIQSLASNRGLTGQLSENELTLFWNHHGPCIFRCRFLPCTNSSLGFNTDAARMAHERLHTQRLLCQQPGCHVGRRGFERQRDLRQHMRTYHHDGSILVPPTVRRIPAKQASSRPNQKAIVFRGRTTECPDGMSSGVQVLEGSDVKYEFRDGNVIPHAITDWVYFYDPDKPSRLRIDLLHEFPSDIYCATIQFSHSGELLAFNNNTSISLHRVSTWELITEFNDPRVGPEDDWDSEFGTCLCFSTDDKLLVVGLSSGFITIWEISSETALQTFNAGAYVGGIALTRDAGLLASASRDRTVRLWNVVDDQTTEYGKCLSLSSDPYCLAFSPDEQSLIIGCHSGELHIWDLASSSRQFGGRYGHSSKVNEISLSPDKTVFVTASDDHTAKLWSVADLRCISTFESYLISGVARSITDASNKKTRVVLGLTDCSIAFLDPKTGEVELILTSYHRNPVIALDTTISEGMCLIASAPEDEGVCIWSLSDLFQD